jgi:cobalt/nickel transport system permease protein
MGRSSASTARYACHRTNGAPASLPAPRSSSPLATPRSPVVARPNRSGACCDRVAKRKVSSMHVPDGFLDVPTSLATGVVAVVGVALALRGAHKELDDRTAPMAGLVATFVFAGQMMNFPVAAGTSGHLLGGALAAVLVGPWTAVLCISVVLVVQALFMADGGITALGTNITLMALVGVGVGWLVFVGVRAVLPKRLSSIAPAAAVGALVSVPIAALAFSLLFAIGGAAPVSTGKVLAAMVSWHAIIGVGEAFITGLVIAGVIAVRPDLVYGARPVLATRELKIRFNPPQTTPPQEAQA